MGSCDPLPTPTPRDPKEGILDFEPTRPLDAPDLLRVSAFERYLVETAPAGEASTAPHSTLAPSLQEDLVRFELGGRQTEVLEVVAASVRHNQALTVHLQVDEHVLPLTLYPREHLFHCALPLPDLLALRLAALQVLHVEPPPSAESPRHPLAGRREHLHALAPLTWALAMRGAREDLLPEIAGPAAYRVAPGLDLRGLELGGAVLAAVRRLHTENVNLRRLAEFPGFDRARASRLLNALYLQAGLIVSRTHPAAVHDRWFDGF
jgi:hypothetical protein